MLSAATLTNNVSFLLVFLEGFLSFFSPCVLPLIPVYISYLAGNGVTTNLDGSKVYNKKIVFRNTLFFILGISSVFFLLGLSFSALGTFFNQHKVLLSRIGGTIIIVMGLVQLDIIKLDFLKIEKRFHFDLNKFQMNPITAYIMGFTFSFAWTPCVGPALSSVLIMASNASSSMIGNLLVLIYTLGFIIPFMILGLFTTEVLNLLRKKRNLLKYTIKIAGIILILMGIMTITGTFTTLSRYLAF